MRIAIIILISISLGLCAPYVLDFFERQGLKDVLGKLPFYVLGIMRLGYNGTRLRIRDPATGRSVWFVKLMIKDKGGAPTRYLMELNPSDCSPTEFEKAQEVLEWAGIDFYLTSEHDPTPQRIVVPCDLDADKAILAGRSVLVGVFHLSENDFLRYGAYGDTKAHNWENIAGWEDYPEAREYFREKNEIAKELI